MREKVETELITARNKMSDLKKEIAETAHHAAERAENDAYGMTPGLSLNHAALNMAILGTRIQEIGHRISMLEWLLRDNPSDEG